MKVKSVCDLCQYGDRLHRMCYKNGISKCHSSNGYYKDFKIIEDLANSYCSVLYKELKKENEALTDALYNACNILSEGVEVYQPVSGISKHMGTDWWKRKCINGK